MHRPASMEAPPAVTLWQVSPGRADLFFDQIEVVEQPFTRWRNPAIRADRLRQQAAGAGEHAFILSQSHQ